MITEFVLFTKTYGEYYNFMRAFPYEVLDTEPYGTVDGVEGQGTKITCRVDAV